MENVRIKKATILKYIKANGLDQNDYQDMLKATDFSDLYVAFNPGEVSRELLSYILFNDTHLTDEIKAELMLKYFEKNKSVAGTDNDLIWSNKITKLLDVWKVCESLVSKEYNCDLEFGGRRYPTRIIPELINMHYKHIMFTVNHWICGVNKPFHFKIFNNDIINFKRQIRGLTFEGLMRMFSIYKQNVNIAEYEQSLEFASHLQAKNGKQYLSNAIGLRYDPKLTPLAMDSFGQMSPSVIEAELEGEVEVENNRKKYYSTLPYVRVFSMQYKTYVCIHAEDLQEYIYNDVAIEKLFLPTGMKTMIQRVFSHSTENLEGDILAYKHGGLIVMAEGNPGVGKTCTAEVYSELNQRPLYVVQVCEIGTNVSDIESNLNTIFKRVEKWGAIILLDEVDVFLSKRNNDIKRSAIVGVFLRLMDYFRGIMFMTTNRSSVLDPAVLSRITLNIKYPDFTVETRRKIWQSKLDDAKLRIDSIDKLAQLNLNGREIRNMVRLGKIMFTDQIQEDEYIALIKNTVPNYIEV